MKLNPKVTRFLTDEEIAFDPDEIPTVDEELHMIVRDIWDTQFVPVGQHLLQRIKTHHTDLVPLEEPR